MPLGEASYDGMGVMSPLQRSMLARRVTSTPLPSLDVTTPAMTVVNRLRTLAQSAAQRDATGGYQPILATLPTTMPLSLEMPTPKIQTLAPTTPVLRQGDIPITTPPGGASPAAAGFTFKPWMLGLALGALVLMKRR